jgi:hypothetical protein
MKGEEHEGRKSTKGKYGSGKALTQVTCAPPFSFFKKPNHPAFHQPTPDSQGNPDMHAVRPLR